MGRSTKPPKTVTIDPWRARVKASRGCHDDGRWYWEARGPGEGKRAWKGLGWRTREEAAAALRELAALPAPARATAAAPSEIVTVRDLLETWIPAQRARVKAGQLRESSVETYRDVCEHLLQSVAWLAVEPAARLSGPRMEDLHTELLGSGWAPNSARQGIEVLGAAARWAMGRELLPLRALRPRLGAAERVRAKNTPTPAELPAYLDAFEAHGPAWLRPFAAVQAATGMRPGEVSVLRPMDIAVPDRAIGCPIVTIPDVPGSTKTGSRRVALPWWAYDELQAIAPASPDSRFFRNSTARTTASGYMGDASEAVGLPRLTAMSWRRFAATEHALLGHDIASSARAMGHSAQLMLEVYAAVGTDALRGVALPDPREQAEVIDLAARRRRG